MPRIAAQKNENIHFSSGNPDAKSGFETEKHNMFSPTPVLQMVIIPTS
jgi:hypothetical protein